VSLSTWDQDRKGGLHGQTTYLHNSVTDATCEPKYTVYLQPNTYNESNILNRNMEEVTSYSS